MSFKPIAKLVDVYDGCKIPAKCGALDLLLVQWDGRIRIIEDRCPHMDARLRDGGLAEGAIECRAHGIAFDLSHGKALGPLSDTLDCLTFYTPVYEGQYVGVDL